jgi:hypothetical protein
MLRLGNPFNLVACSHWLKQFLDYMVFGVDKCYTRLSISLDVSQKTHNNRRNGRPPKLTGTDEAQLVAMFQAGIAVRKIAEVYGVSGQTVYNIVRRHSTPSTEAA